MRIIFALVLFIMNAGVTALCVSREQYAFASWFGFMSLAFLLNVHHAFLIELRELSRPEPLTFSVKNW